MDKNKLDMEKHVRILCASYHHYTGLELLPTVSSDYVTALQDAPFAVLSHGTEADPILNYANNMGLKVFGYEWDELITLPSRFTAEPLNQEARAELLARVAKQGYVDDYTGVRISKSGTRFIIKNATVWNLLDEHGLYYGQAAMIADWTLI